jgi:hypothetical protein
MPELRPTASATGGHWRESLSNGAILSASPPETCSSYPIAPLINLFLCQHITCKYETSAFQKIEMLSLLSARHRRACLQVADLADL